MVPPPRGAWLLGIGLLVGCADEGLPAREGSASAPSVASGPASAALCSEHGVLESVCTQCNPALAPVFQAKGDWCGEHGFPESFCPVCSPEAGGRPPVAPVGGDGAPADGTVVRFKAAETADLVGIQTASAEAAAWVDGTDAVVRLAWDATRVAAPGVATDGIVARVSAEVGDRVGAGQVLAEVRSAHAAMDRSAEAAARAERDAAAAALDRKRQLQGEGVASIRDVQVAEAARARAEANLQAIEAEIGLIGHGVGDRTPVRAPFAGVVTARHVRVGEGVAAGAPLFEVVDPSLLQAEIDVPEAALREISPGAEVRLRLDADPDTVLVGSLATLAASVDPATRTARARMSLDNADGRLRAGQFGRAEIRGGGATQAVVVPDAAVQRASTVQLVFVQQAPDRYVARRVRVLGRQGDRVRVAGGVTAGDTVVTTGSFLLKTETLPDSIGAGCCDVE